MKRARVPETDSGIQGAACVEIYDAFARNMRDKGYHPVKEYISRGLSGGAALEIGPGPGYIGLEWLRACPGTTLTGLEISTDMISVAKRNAHQYGLDGRACYVEGNSMRMPFKDNSFDCAFSNGSLHEWEKPELVFAEIIRVLKPGGMFCVTDLRRNVGLLARFFGLASARPRAIRQGFQSSLNASYTAAEIEKILHEVGIHAKAEEGFMDLSVVGQRES
ncbi:MAG: class I SAM-dependent methyltransferase [Spirochaetia bacterium]|jgi:ubiquinone/menaquinone biosynthesis C-methylase UbiE